jgi:hypothetical protein
MGPKTRFLLLSDNLSTKEFEAALFRNVCLAFRSPTDMDLCLKLQSSMMFASIPARPGAAGNISLLSIVMKTPVALVKQWEASLDGCGECLY